MLTRHNPAGRRICPQLRDSVTALSSDHSTPKIVSVSDVHGYLDAVRSALLTVRDHPEHQPVVVEDDRGRLRWADEDYVLLFNGDLIDRGPANEEVLELVARLAAEAPVGRVRTTLGNHEGIVLSQAYFDFPDWYSAQIGTDRREMFLRQVVAGEVVAAYQGYNFTYAHAGSPTPYDVETVNDELARGAEELLEAAGTIDSGSVQRRVITEYADVLGVGDVQLKGRGAGLIWLDFDALPSDAPPQVVGHTRHDRPRTKGTLHCQNVIRNNLGSEGGEAVFVESPASLTALTREQEGDVRQMTLWSA